MYGTLYSMSMERITYILKDRIGVYEGVWKPFNDFIKKIGIQQSFYRLRIQINFHEGGDVGMLATDKTWRVGHNLMISLFFVFWVPSILSCNLYFMVNCVNFCNLEL